MPKVIAAQPNMGGALCESSVIPFLVLRRKVWLRPAAGVPYKRAVTLPLYESARHLAHSKILSGSKSPQKCVYSIPAQETAKYRAKFGWPLVSDVTALTKPRRETNWNLLGCPKLQNRSQPLVGQSLGPKFAILWGRLEEVLMF